MPWLHIALALALLQFIWFAMLVGRARGVYGVPAPATTGNPNFERVFRVQQNTLELLIILIPAAWIAATYWSPLYVAIAVAVYVVGRQLYAIGYVKEAAKRSTGFLLSFIPTVLLVVADLVGALKALFF